MLIVEQRLEMIGISGPFINSAGRFHNIMDKDEGLQKKLTQLTSSRVE